MCSKVGQVLLQIEAIFCVRANGITNRRNFYYKVGKLLQRRAVHVSG